SSRSRCGSMPRAPSSRERSSSRATSWRSDLREVLGPAIQDATRKDFEIVGIEDVGGGCIHGAKQVLGETATGKKSYFAKQNEAEKRPLCEAEQDGLAAIAEAGQVKVPTVVTIGDDGDDAWLVLEWLELVPLD